MREHSHSTRKETLDAVEHTKLAEFRSEAEGLRPQVKSSPVQRQSDDAEVVVAFCSAGGTRHSAARQRTCQASYWTNCQRGGGDLSNPR